MALDQLAPPAPPAPAGQVAGGPPSALGQVADAVGQVAGAAGGQGAGGAGGGWAGGQVEELLRAEEEGGGDQGGKLCSMQMHGQGEERKEKEEEKRKIGNCATSKRVKEIEPLSTTFPFLIHYQKSTSSCRDSTKLTKCTKYQVHHVPNVPSVPSDITCCHRCCPSLLLTLKVGSLPACDGGSPAVG